MELIALGLLGATALAALFDLFDDDDDPVSEDTGETLFLNESGVVEGTDGDDTLPPGLEADGVLTEINLRAGDDTATIEFSGTLDINGGDGDDTVTAIGVTNSVFGGGGDDVLTADDSNNLFGEAGNDTLTMLHGSYDQGEDADVLGGEGDDTITVRTNAFVPEFIQSDVGGVVIDGGDAADEINVVYQYAEGLEGPEELVLFPGESSDALNAEYDYEGQFVRVLNFEPGQDTLRIEVDALPGAEERDVSVEMDQTEEADGTFTSLISLTFAASSEFPEAINTLRVTSDQPFTLDDIELVGFDAVMST